MTSTSDRAFFGTYLGAWNAHDSVAVARHMADDAIYEDVALGRMLHGPSEIASSRATRRSGDRSLLPRARGVDY
jgi:ketosteroid isomerase-like protein